MDARTRIGSWQDRSYQSEEEPRAVGSRDPFLNGEGDGDNAGAGNLRPSTKTFDFVDALFLFSSFPLPPRHLL